MDQISDFLISVYSKVIRQFHNSDNNCLCIIKFCCSMWNKPENWHLYLQHSCVSISLNLHLCSMVNILVAGNICEH